MVFMVLLRAAQAIYECWRQRLCRCWGFSYAAAFSLTDLCTQLLKHGLNVAPLNIGAGWPCKDQSEGALVFAFHGSMVLFYGTLIKG